MADVSQLPRPPQQGPIFIVGPMGSGTTLLRLMLDSHPNLAIAPETGFMRAYNANRYIPFKIRGRGWARRLGWSDAELDALLHDFYETIFRRYADQHGKRRWGEKTPIHVWHVTQISRLFPDAVFVGINRHPGGVMGSNMRRWGHSYTKTRTHYQRYSHELARQAALHQDRFAFVRYEELLLEPERTMRELLDWLEEPWAPEVLAHDQIQAARGGRRMVEGRNVIDEPIDITRVNAWVQRMSEEDRAKIALHMGRLAEFFGYDAGDPAVLDPLAGDGRLVAHGTELAERMERFAELSLTSRPTPPVYEERYDPRRFEMLSIERLERLMETAAARPPLWRRVAYRVKRRLLRSLGRDPVPASAPRFPPYNPPRAADAQRPG